jgi:hypothetical protein
MHTVYTDAKTDAEWIAVQEIEAMSASLAKYSLFRGSNESCHGSVDSIHAEKGARPFLQGSHQSSSL